MSEANGDKICPTCHAPKSLHGFLLWKLHQKLPQLEKEQRELRQANTKKYTKVK